MRLAFFYAPFPSSSTYTFVDQGAPDDDKNSLTPNHALEEETRLMALPAPDRGADVISAHELAARASAEDSENPSERPGMFMAAIGEGFSRLQLPFALPSSQEKEEVQEILAHSNNESDVAFSDLQGSRDSQALFNEVLDDISAGPVVYSENKRYMVERDNRGLEIFRSTVAKGDSAGVILNEWLPSAEVATLIDAVSSVYSLKNIVVGRPFSIIRNVDSGDFVNFIYEPDTTQRIVISRQGENFVAVKELIEYDTKLARVEGTINSSLFEAVADSGEGAMLAVQLADVFSCEVNFINEIRKGDSFNVVVEKRYRDGEFKGYGNMVAAHFINQGRTFEAYLFPDANGKFRHYNAKGEALQKALLKAPLAFTRVSSGYSMNRRHPVFGNTRPHQGVDYAAPKGTPIKAVGEGTITRIGWGNGYGNMIVVKHTAGLQSQYAHMSGFAKGLKKGAHVKQGQIIGYVGATGVATGPHLDFRIMQNNKFMDPRKLIVPRLDPVDKTRMPLFKDTVATALSYLKEDVLAEYKPIKPVTRDK